VVDETTTLHQVPDKRQTDRRASCPASIRAFLLESPTHHAIHPLYTSLRLTARRCVRMELIAHGLMQHTDKKCRRTSYREELVTEKAPYAHFSVTWQI